MLIAAFIATIQVADAVAADPEPEAIVVLGRRLGDWRGTVSRERPCRTRRSSGDPELDAMACETLQRCFETIQGRADIIAAANPRATRRERQRLIAPLNAEMPRCLEQGYQRGLAELAGQRSASGSE